MSTKAAPGEARLTRAELEESLHDHKKLASKLCSFGQDIPGTSSFWFQRKTDLKCMLEQSAWIPPWRQEDGQHIPQIPSLWSTRSCSYNHDKVIHRLMPVFPPFSKPGRPGTKNAAFHERIANSLTHPQIVSYVKALKIDLALNFLGPKILGIQK